MEASFPNGWAYRNRIELKLSATGTTNLSNFPVLLVWTGSQATSNLPQAMFDTSGSTPAKSDGSDVRLSLDKYGNLPVPFEIVSFSTNSNPSNAYAEIWVRLTTVYWNQDTSFYVWWGNAYAVALTADDSDGEYAVWDSNYQGVYHLNESSGNILDSTVNQSMGTPSGSSFPNGSTGKIQKAQNFVSANSNYVSLANEASFNYTTAMTVECWVNITTFANAYMAIVTKGDSAWRLHRNNTFSGLQFTQGNGSVFVTTSTLNTGTWYHIVGRYDGTNLQIFVNGVSVASIASGALPTNNYAVAFGENLQVTGRNLNGLLDEVHLSNIARSNDWILTSYNLQNSPNSYFYLGPVELTSASGVATGWKRRVVLTNDHTKLGGDESQVVVPLVWTGSQSTSNLPQEMMVSGGLYAAKSDGSDLRVFADVNGNEELPYEIVTFSQNVDPSLARAEIWIRVRFLSSSVNTTVYIWYSNPSASAVDSRSSFGPAACWRDIPSPGRGYTQVYHMDGTGDIASANLDGLDATNHGSTSDTGKIGNCRAFNGSSQYISATQESYDDFSVAFWLKTTAVAGSGSQWYQGIPIISADTYGTNSTDWSIALVSTNRLGFGVGNGSGGDFTIQSSVAVNDGNWHYIVCTRAISSGAMAIYVDGSSVGTGTGYTLRLNASSSLNIGRFVLNATYFTGDVDEVWTTVTSLSSTEITSLYNSQSSPQTFFLVGTPDSRIFPNGWRWKAKLTQNHAQNSADQTDFVSLLAWTGSSATSCLPQVMFNSSGAQSAKSDGSDIRITSDVDGAVQLPFEIVVFSTNSNTANARAEIYVKVPQVSASTDINIYIWWGNNDAVAYQASDYYGSNAVWSDYLMVFHFQSTTLTDSTGNGWSMTNSGVTTTTGPIVGNAGNFVPNSYAYTPSQPASIAWLASGSFYITAWTFYNSFADSWSRIFDFGSGAPLDNIFLAHRGTTADSRFGCDNNTTESACDNSGTFVLSTWAYIGCRWQLGTGMQLDLNSVTQSATVVDDTPLRNAVRSNGYVGRSNFAADGYLNGRIDELRVRKSYSALFRVSDYNSLNSPSTYWSTSSVTWVGIKILIGGAWRDITNADAIVGGSYRLATSLNLLVNGAWRDIV